MKIGNISYFTTVKANKEPQSNKVHNNVQSPIEHKSLPKMFAYQDFNISFAGRTPEDFYAQDFNRENMPDTMKEYLNYDYEQRQHIPPEQMMREAFKYIEIADNFDDVKDIYPNEKLFNSLHDNYQNNRTSILGEIKIAKELADEPLFKDGSDDFGIYLLKKIYLEGKTVKEISKDFYDKDMNEVYEGVISKPIDNKTTAAYGIQYPKTAFWNSFIATREEYKKFFVTLPKNSVNPAVNLANINHKASGQSVSIDTPEHIEHKPRVRKYNLKGYQKKLITDDIKDAKADALEIEKKIRRRFGKDDPQASFIVKYLSPIMAVAADRVHLSEEMRAFCEDERMNGKNGEDEYMFKRFWKQNPQVLNYYAQTIADTMDYFEEVYGNGGSIPINKDLEVIKPDTENQKAIDSVTSEFLELLDYTQTIMPKRELRYALHDKLQNDWNEHFMTRYGAPTVLTDEAIESLEKVQETELQTSEVNVQKLFKNGLRNKSRFYPTPYAIKYVNYMMNNKNLDDDYKLAYAYYLGEQKIPDIKLSQEEFLDKFYEEEGEFAYKNMHDDIAARLAMVETLARNDYRNYVLYTLNTYEFPVEEVHGDKIKPIILENKDLLNKLYLEYQKPIKTKEMPAIVNELFNQVVNYKRQEHKTVQDVDVILLMFKEACNTPPRAEFMKQLLKLALTKNLTYANTILNEKDSESEKRAKFENIMLLLVSDLINSDDTLLVQLIGEENLQKHFSELKNKDLKYNLMTKVSNLTPTEKDFFTLTDSKYQKEFNEDPEMCERKYGIKLEIRKCK